MTPAFSFLSTPRARLLLFIVMVAVFFCATMVFWLLSGRTSGPAAPMACETDSLAKAVTMSSPVPDVALLTLDRTPVMLHDLVAGSRYTVFIFCSYRCPCSDGYVGRLRALKEAYGTRGVALYGIHANANETLDGMKGYVHRVQYPLTVLRDRDGAAADLLGATITPEAFVLDASYRVRYHGRIDDDKSGEAVGDHSLQTALDTLLNGGLLRTREKISRGCAIVRSSTPGPARPCPGNTTASRIEVPSGVRFTHSYPAGRTDILATTLRTPGNPHP
jgi:hypothetical protein